MEVDVWLGQFFSTTGVGTTECLVDLLRHSPTITRQCVFVKLTRTLKVVPFFEQFRP